MKKFEDMFPCFDRIHNVTDGRTYRQTDIMPWHRPRYAYKLKDHRHGVANTINEVTLCEHMTSLFIRLKINTALVV